MKTWLYILLDRVLGGVDKILPSGLVVHPVRRTAHVGNPRRASMKREVIRVEPLSTYLERWKAPTSAVTRSGDTIYVSGFPPFDPDTGEVVEGPIERRPSVF